MKIDRKVYALFAAAVLAAPMTGCMVYARPPRMGVVYVAARPPVERVEVIPATPGAGYVWIKGYWGYRGGNYEWIGGRWERPIEGRREWVPHHWEHDRNGWYLVEGHWR
jgi:hypothetical protein